MSKKILILNGSPRSKGNTAMLCDALNAGARSAGHQVTRLARSEERRVGKECCLPW